ncbi:NACHT domain-containing protein [Micromonospora sp. CPCC 205371]|nr:NACHT domain-containing protein [Micromonospora sp. CPCC 205371]
MRKTRWRGLDPWRTLGLLSGLSALAFVVVIANSETRLLQNLDLWAAAASVLAAVAASGVSTYQLFEARRGKRERTPEHLDRALSRLAGLELDRVTAELRRRAPERDLVEILTHDRPSLGDRGQFLRPDPGSVDLAAEIADSYRRLRAGRLAIVGGAGSGKTTLALMLIQGLLRSRTATDEPVPFLVKISSWDPHTELLEAWLGQQLVERFPVLRLSPHDAAGLVADGRVLPVLDGLDELPAKQHAAALARLTHSRLGRRPYVLTCRPEVLAASVDVGASLPNLAVIELRPVSAPAIAAYLRRHADGVERWEPVLAELDEHPAGLLARTLSAPWVAYAARIGYANPSTDPSQLLDAKRFPSAEALEAHLLDSWLDGLISRTGAHPGSASFEPAATKRWLAWLAAHLLSTGSRQFAWWNLWDTLMFRLLTRFPPTAALLRAMTSTVPPGQRELAIREVALATAQEHPPRRLARPRLRRAFMAVGAALAAGSALAAALWSLAPAPASARASQATLAVAFAVLGGLLGLSIVATAPVKPTGTLSDQIRRDRAVAAARASVAALLAYAAAGMGLLSEGTAVRVWAASAAVAAVTFAAVMVAVSEWGRFGVARALLASRGRLPWSLVAFIEYAEAIGVLRATGGGYEFRHASLQDLLAGSMPVAPAAREPEIPPDLTKAILDEVFELPEIAVRLAQPPIFEPTPRPEGEPGRAAAEDRVRVTIEHQVRQILAERPDTVLARGAEWLTRFQDVRDRMTQAVGRPRWARPARAYQALAWTAVALSLVGAGLIMLPRTAFRPIVEGALTAATVMAALGLAPILYRRRAGRVASWSPPWPLIGYVLVVATVAQIAQVVPESVSRGPALPVATLAVAACWPLALLAWLRSKPHQRRQKLLSSDDPADWPDVPGTEHLRRAADQARQDWLTALAREGVMPLLRDQLEAGPNRFGTTLLPFDPSRLGGVSRADQLVETAATRLVNQRLRQLSSVSVGISGSRGAGKSTVLQRFCTSRFTRTTDDLLLLVPAPTAYDRREFLVHLFAEVCERVAGSERFGTPAERRVRAAVARTLPATLVTGGLTTAFLAWRWPAVVSTSHWLTANPRAAAIVGGLLLTLAGVAAALVTSKSVDRASQRSAGTQQLAAAHLRRLRYQLTSSTTRDGKITLPGGFELGASGGVERTEHLRSYPELVADFRELLEQVALERRSVGSRVVIGIDELDKIATADEAERFLNDLKVIFGVPGCYFLVAVSDDALVAFDRRALAVRTTFDSAFDQIVSVPPLDLHEAREMLSLRGVALPEPYLWLCHALSGGLPRDLLRSVLGLATTASTFRLDELAPLAVKMIEHDVRTVLTAQLRQAEVVAGAIESPVTRWLARAADAEPTGVALEQVARTAPAVDAATAGEATAALTALVGQASAYACYAATLLRAFAEATPDTVAWLRHDAETHHIDLLATARATLATSVDSVVAKVQRFRHAAPFLHPLPDAPTPPEGNSATSSPPIVLVPASPGAGELS